MKAMKDCKKCGGSGYNKTYAKPGCVTIKMTCQCTYKADDASDDLTVEMA